MIIRNNKTTSALYKGTKEIIKRYKGTLLVYESFKNLIASGVPLTLLNCKGVDLIDYKIYGESIQNGEPTPDTPIEIESVGERILDISSMPIYDGQVLATTQIPIDKNYIFMGMNANGLIIPGYITSYEINGNNIKFTPNSNYRGFGFCLKVEIGKKYTLSYDGSDTNPYLLAYKPDGTKIGSVGNNYLVTEEVGYIVFLIVGDIANNEVSVSNIEVIVNDTNKYKIPVKVSGKNLFNKDNLSAYGYNGDTFTIDGVNSAKIYQTDGDYGISIQNIFKENTQYSIKFREKYVGIKGYVKVDFIYSDGTIGTAIGENSTSTWVTRTATSVKGKTLSKIRLSNAGNGSSYAYYVDLNSFQLEKGTTVTEYEPYVELTTYDIYLDEPLRKIGDYADYIDFKKQKVFRNVEVLDDTGTLTIEESLKGVVDDTGTPIELPNIPTIKGTTILEVDTTIQPSNLEVVYKGKEVK